MKLTRLILLAVILVPCTIQPIFCQTPPTPSAWWKAEGNALDSSGTNNGVINSSFAYVPGNTGQAFSFAGATITVPDATNLDPVTNLTVQMWVKGIESSPFEYVLTKNGGPAGASYAFYTANNNGLGFWVNVPSDTTDFGLIISPLVAPSAIWDNNWHQVTGVYDGMAVHLYIDAVEVGSGTSHVGGDPSISYSSAGPLVLGNFSQSGSSSWPGAIDDLKVFDRALAASEVMDTFTNSASTFATNSLASWWKADGNTLDSQSTNNGTLHSATIGFVQGKVGQGFLSAGGSVLIPDSATLEPSNITVQVWVKSSSPGAFKYVLSKCRIPTYGSYALYTGGNGGMAFFAAIGPTGSGSLVVSPLADPGIVWDGAWHQVTGIYDGAGVHLYIDALEVGSGTPASGPIDYATTNSAHSGAFVIANDPTLGFAMSGGIDEVKIWDQALTPQQVLATYQSGRLVSWWRAEGNANDSLGTNNGTTNGAMAFGQGRLAGTSFKLSRGVVVVPDSASLEPTNVTVEALVSGSLQGANKYVISKSFSASSASYAFFTGAGGGLDFSVNVNGSSILSPAISPSAIWDGYYHFVAGTYDGQVVRLFLDGNEVGTGTPAAGSIQYGTNPSAGSLLFGDFSSSLSASNFVGLLDDVKVYSVALSSQDIQADAFQPALITAQPQSVQAAAGSTVSFTVSVVPPGVTYQWLFNGTNIPGATQATLIVTNVQNSQVGSYRATVSVGAGTFYVTNSLLGGNAFHLPGIRLDVPEDPSLEPASQLTVQAWVRHLGSPGGFKYLLTKSLTGGVGSYAFFTASSGGLEFYDYLTSGSLWFSPDAGTNVWDGNWHQVTGIYDGEFTRLYVDGVQVGTGTDGVASGVPLNYGGRTVNGDFIIGDFYSGGGSTYGGDIDEVKLFGQALSDADVLDTYTNLTGAASTNGLISWWKGENNTFDSAGQNNGHFLPLPGSVLSDAAALTLVVPQASFTDVSSPGGNFHAILAGPSGQTYVIQRSSSLTSPSWTPIITNTVPFSFNDPVVTTRQFYRAVAQ